MDINNGVAVIDLVLDMAGEDCCDILLDMDVACGLDPWILLEPGRMEDRGEPTVVKFRLMAWAFGWFVEAPWWVEMCVDRCSWSRWLEAGNAAAVLSEVGIDASSLSIRFCISSSSCWRCSKLWPGKGFSA